MGDAPANPQTIGPLRWLVAGLVLLSLPAIFLQDVKVQPWRVLFVNVMPGVALFLIWAIPLDVIMARVFASGADETTRARYRKIIRFDLLVWAVLLICWGFFFYNLLANR